MPPMRWRQARSAEAKCLWSRWRGVSDFSTPLCVSAPVQAQPRPYRSAKRPDLAKRHAAARATRQPFPLFRLPITSFAGHANLDLLASPARSDCLIRVALTGQSGSPKGAIVVVRPSQAAARKASRGLDPTVISLHPPELRALDPLSSPERLSLRPKVPDYPTPPAFGASQTNLTRCQSGWQRAERMVASG
jgi:hypothetical protein